MRIDPVRQRETVRTTYQNRQLFVHVFERIGWDSRKLEKSNKQAKTKTKKNQKKCTHFCRDQVRCTPATRTQTPRFVKMRIVPFPNNDYSHAHVRGLRGRRRRRTTESLEGGAVLARCSSESYLSAPVLFKTPMLDQVDFRWAARIRVALCPEPCTNLQTRLWVNFLGFWGGCCTGSHWETRSPRISSRVLRPPSGRVLRVFWWALGNRGCASGNG